MEWLKDRNRDLLMGMGVDGVDGIVSAGMSRFCCLYYHKDSPLQKTKNPKTRFLDAINGASLPEIVAKQIAFENLDFQKVLTRWFLEYQNDWVEYWVSLCIKINQFNSLLREKMDLSECSADDKAKIIKMNCDAATQLEQIIKLKHEVEGRLFVDKDNSDETKRALSKAMSPESQAGLNA